MKIKSKKEITNTKRHAALNACLLSPARQEFKRIITLPSLITTQRSVRAARNIVFFPTFSFLISNSNPIIKGCKHPHCSSTTVNQPSNWSDSGIQHSHLSDDTLRHRKLIPCCDQKGKETLIEKYCVGGRIKVGRRQIARNYSRSICCVLSISFNLAAGNKENTGLSSTLQHVGSHYATLSRWIGRLNNQLS